MYDVYFSEEQRALRDMAREFARKEVLPQAEAADERAEFNRELFAQMGEMGFMGLSVPAEYGGSEAGLLSTALVVEEIARTCGATGMGLAAHYLGCSPILIAGTAEQKRRFLPAIARGEHLCAFGLTEPQAGSDVASIQSTARRDGDTYVLNGSKIFITNGGEAQMYVVFVKTDPTGGIRGISALVLPKDTSGFTFGRKERKVGMRGSVNRELIFSDCRIPIDHRLGGEGEGFKIAMKALDHGRVVTSAYTLGVAEAALALATEHARQREQFGRPIAEFQAVQMLLADMRVDVESARLLMYDAAMKADRGLPYSLEAAMAKLRSSDAAMKAATDAVQVLGGYGYMMDSPAQRYLRDAKITQILEGTNQIMRTIIARKTLTEV